MSAKAELALAAFALAAASCAVGPRYVRPQPPLAQGYTVEPVADTPAASGQAQGFVSSRALPADWWRLLRCPPVDGVVADALAGSPSLDAARATLARSQDTLRAGYGIFFPQADLGASAARQRYSPERIGSTLPASVFNLFTLSASVSYALDVWGGQRRSVEALAAQAEAQRYALTAAYLSLAGNVVNAVIAGSAYGAELDATNELLGLEEQQVALGKAQATAGTLAYVNVLSLESQVALTRATVPPLEERVDQSRHLIALLTGRLPGSWSPPAIALSDLKLPATIPLSLPSALVRQRPDILMAEAQLHASTAQIGVATAAMLPSITLGAGYGANNTAVGDLASSGSVFWSLLAGVTQPIFHGGTLYYQRWAAIDARDQALASYHLAVLTGFQQVADSLRALTHDADTLAAQSAALDSSASAFRLVQIDYQAGIATYLQVLTANAQYLQSRIGVIEAEAQRLQDTVALFVALGGGWWNNAAGPAASN